MQDVGIVTDPAVAVVVCCGLSTSMLSATRVMATSSFRCVYQQLAAVGDRSKKTRGFFLFIVWEEEDQRISVWLWVN